MSSKSAPLGIRRVERPRPLGSVSHIGIPNSSNAGNAPGNRRLSAQDVSEVEEALQLLDRVADSLMRKNYNTGVTDFIIRLNVLLKIHGSQVELFHREVLDKTQIILRNACKDTNLNIVARLNLLEIIELRSYKWVLNDSVINYYKQKKAMVEANYDEFSASEMASKKYLNVNAPLFTPQQPNTGNGGNILDQLLPHRNVSSIIPEDQILVTSGKYSGPTQPHGKSYFKDEVYIRNADSGKVLPGTVDRLVQITGSVPTNVGRAKILMEDTIRRNQSPLPDFMGDSDQQPIMESIPNAPSEYKFSVKVGEDTVKISSSNLQLVKNAKIVLDEYFCSNNFRSMVSVARQPLFPDSTKEAVKMAESEAGGGHSQLRRENFSKTQMAKLDKKVTHYYGRDTLLQLSEDPICSKKPLNWDCIATEFPDIVRKVGELNEDGLLPQFANQMSWDPVQGQWVVQRGQENTNNTRG